MSRLVLGTIIGRAAEVSSFTVLASVLAFGALFGLIGAIIGVPIAAGLQIVAEELTAGERARIAAADAAKPQQTAKRLVRAHAHGRPCITPLA
jgi:predicted PurR-regulated permease PerM